MKKRNPTVKSEVSCEGGMNNMIIRKIIYQCLGYRRGENILIVTDDRLEKIARIFYRGIRSMRLEVVLLCIVPRKIHGEEPPKEAAAAFKSSDIALLITEKSLSHSKARQEACKKYGTRIVSMPGITMDIFKRSVDIDYLRLQRKIKQMMRVFKGRDNLQIRTKKGTDLSMSIKGRDVFSDNGLYRNKGSFGNLPAGEVCIAPLEETVKGRLIVDASFAGIGKLNRPIKIEIKNGRAVWISDYRLRKLLEPLGKTALRIAEFGLGLNPQAAVTGNVLEDEKALGTAHIALGDNLSFGGRTKAPCHLDGVFFEPKICLDNREINV